LNHFMIKESGVITILGCGSSAGVPLIGCKCVTCHSPNPKNQRLRPSIQIAIGNKRIVCDTGPDFRLQALTHKIDHLDGIILTHMHFDHIAGIDDTRVYVLDKKEGIPLLISSRSYEDFVVKYGYFFLDSAVATAKVIPHCIDQFPCAVNFCGVDFLLFDYYQQQMPVMGFRLGNFAYATDVKNYDHRLIEALQGVDTLVISALKEQSTHFHLGFEEAVMIHRAVGAKKTYLTHLSHDVNYEKGLHSLPDDVQLAYDGLEIHFEYERKTD
jgi:phosphoribosyl 1,2-cyclic phosphate phosphodiesterase